LTTENINPIHLFKGMKLRFDHQPVHMTSRIHSTVGPPPPFSPHVMLYP